MDDLEEVWVPVEGFDKYLISNHGQVKHVDRVSSRTSSVNNRGFPVITLYRDNDPSRYLRQINKLVADAFLPPPDHHDETSVWHMDGNLLNCYISNLKWDTRARVTEWNRMHREGTASYSTPPVRNNVTGAVYDNAFDCGMNEGKLESTVIWLIEGNAELFNDPNAKYCYVKDW